MQGQTRLRRWSMGGATGLKTMFSSTEQGEKRKTTLKMKPHRVQKPFKVAAGQSIKIITILQSIHTHQNNCTQHTAIRVTPSTLHLNK